MATIKNNQTRHEYAPDYAVPPGRTLQETIDSLGIDQRELALRSGLSTKHINQVIKGVASITQDTAIRLERVTGVPARMWNALEATYREQQARLTERARLQRDLEWMGTIPTKELTHRGVIKGKPIRSRCWKRYSGSSAWLMSMLGERGGGFRSSRFASR